MDLLDRYMIQCDIVYKLPNKTERLSLINRETILSNTTFDPRKHHLIGIRVRTSLITNPGSYSNKQETWTFDEILQNSLNNHIILDNQSYFLADLYYEVYVCDQNRVQLFINDMIQFEGLKLNNLNIISDNINWNGRIDSFEEAVDLLITANPLFLMEWLIIVATVKDFAKSNVGEWYYNLSEPEKVEAYQYLRDLLEELSRKQSLDVLCSESIRCSRKLAEPLVIEQASILTPRTVEIINNTLTPRSLENFNNDVLTPRTISKLSKVLPSQTIARINKMPFIPRRFQRQ
jgi:hypothetical protein